MTIDWTYAQNVAMAEAGPYVRRLEEERAVLPFLSLPFAEELTKELEGLEGHLRKFEHMLVLGIGGSALGARALQKSFFPQQDRPGHKGPWLWIADNVDGVGFAATLAGLPVDKTLVVAISKSGGTIETVAQYFLALEWLKKGAKNWQEHVLLVTDTKKGFLREEADTHSLRTLEVPDNLGGRYSVLSAVGLVPAVFMGMDWKALLKGAIDMGRPLAENPSKLGEHPAWKMANWAHNFEKAGKDQLIFFSYEPAWAMFGPWFCQLWAESLGKEGKGTMPLPAVGVTDQHSLLQMFLDGPKNKACLFLTTKEGQEGLTLPTKLPEPWGWLQSTTLYNILKAETLATRMNLCEKGVDVVALEMQKPDAYEAGRLIMLLEAMTVFTGWLMGINPIDQPAVEEGKRLAYAKLGAPGREEEGKRLAAFLGKGKKEERV